MKTFLRTSLLISALALGACSSETVAFRTIFSDTLEPSRTAELAQTVNRVLERRVESMEANMSNLTNTLTEEGAEVSFMVSPADRVPLLTNELIAPFSLRLMRVAQDNETPDLTLSDAKYMELGVTEKDVLWLTPGEEEVEGRTSVTIIFTTEGGKKVKDALTKTKGQVALIVRDQLVSTFQSQGIGKENIIIDGVPAELAGVFADDVNVGVHVTFVPKK